MEIPKCHCKVECWCYFDITTYIWHFKCKRVKTTCKDSKKYKIVWKKSYRQPCDFVHTVQIDKPTGSRSVAKVQEESNRRKEDAPSESRSFPKLELLRLLKNFEIKPDFAHLSELFTHLRKYERTYSLVFSCYSQTMDCARLFWKKIDKIKAAVNSLPDREMLQDRIRTEPPVVKQRIPELIKYLLYKPIEISDGKGVPHHVQRRYPKAHKAHALQIVSLPIEERILLTKDPKMQKRSSDPELTLEQMEELVDTREVLFSDGSEDEDCTDEDSDSQSEDEPNSPVCEESDTDLSESEKDSSSIAGEST